MWGMIARVAARQHGVISHGQLREAGLIGRRINRAVEAGRLFPVHRAVFAVGHNGISEAGRMLAAVLACGEGSVVSHGTAAFLWGLWRFQPDKVDVIAPCESRRGEETLRGISGGGRADRARWRSGDDSSPHDRRPRRCGAAKIALPNGRAGCGRRGVGRGGDRANPGEGTASWRACPARHPRGLAGPPAAETSAKRSRGEAPDASGALAATRS